MREVQVENPSQAAFKLSNLYFKPYLAVFENDRTAFPTWDSGTFMLDLI